MGMTNVNQITDANVILGISEAFLVKAILYLIISDAQLGKSSLTLKSSLNCTMKMMVFNLREL